MAGLACRKTGMDVQNPDIPTVPRGRIIQSEERFLKRSGWLAG